MAEADNRGVESLEDAYREDLHNELTTLPRVADAMARGERVELNLTRDEIDALTVRMVWLLSAWVRSLTAEIDRLHALLDEQADARQDLDS